MTTYEERVKTARRLAGTLRKPANLIVGKTKVHDIDTFIITDSIVIFRLEPGPYMNFTEKWNKYKGNPSIPEMDKAEAYGLSKRKEWEPKKGFTGLMDRVMLLPESTPDAHDTNFVYDDSDKELMVIKNDKGDISLIDKKYQDVLDLGDSLKTSGGTNPVYVLEGATVVAVVMPIRVENFGETLRDLAS